MPNVTAQTSTGSIGFRLGLFSRAQVRAVTVVSSRVNSSTVTGRRLQFRATIGGGRAPSSITRGEPMKVTR